ncbi:N-acetylmuramoyl-L-alanine amidase [Cellulomonas sp.]|uniref:peptidoglycan recognition protein family protein n=1 Tax=Cellulomonas sp. TaxID=40001 RepID=UPI001B081D34|nr:N-acetylmuramoyl-L-alanine amidase [Cellulomonas sp.]MBO9556666.1 N-acetylmuramoyl-L-alanine amidase [Cellulomonas sp.]
MRSGTLGAATLALLMMAAAPATAAVVQAPPAAVGAPTAAGTAVSTVELDLSGVAAAAVADLPEVPPEPVETALDQGAPAPAPAVVDEVAQAGASTPTSSTRTLGMTTSARFTVRSAATTPEPAAPSPEPDADPSTEPGTSTATPSPAEGDPDEPLLPSASPQPEDEPTPAPQPTPTAAADGPEADVLTAEMDTAEFSVLGVSWQAVADAADDDTVIRYRVRQDGVWSEWEAVAPSDIGPDASSPERGTGQRRATDPIVALRADGLQVWANSTSGTVTGLKAVLIDPGTRAADATAGTRPASAGTDEQDPRTPVATTASVAAAAPAPPTIITRAQWGADESQRTCRPDLSTEVVAAAIHHTASTSTYGEADVPGLLRGFLAYHTRPEAAGGRGWCDIGYNFLVDQFGRVFEGRAGGTDVPVVGVHTGGFNSRTFGVAAIGSFDAVAPTPAMTESISRLVAWKFAMHRITGSGSVSMVSGGGASKYPAGTVVTFPTIFGHRDAQFTSCPGQRLYDQLGSIRARVAALADAAVASTPFGGWDSTSTTAGSITVSGWLIDPDLSAPITVRVSVDGVETRAVADRDRPDVGRLFPAYGSRHGYSVTAPARGGTHVVCVRAVNVGAGSDRILGCRYVTVANTPPIGQVDSVTLDAAAGTAKVSGWALDRDTAEPIAVHVYVNTGGTAVMADRERPDLASISATTRHGFEVTVRVPAGNSTLCVYAINSPAGDNPSLGCRALRVAATPPVGQIDSVRLNTQAGTATVSGWALDPDTPQPIDVHVYVDTGGTPARADRERPDLAAISRTTNHGYEVTVRVPAGSHRLCVYAINVPIGDNPSLGCRVVSR